MIFLLNLNMFPSGEDSARRWKTRDAICRGKGEGERQPGKPGTGFSQQHINEGGALGQSQSL